MITFQRSYEFLVFVLVCVVPCADFRVGKTFAFAFASGLTRADNLLGHGQGYFRVVEGAETSGVFLTLPTSLYIIYRRPRLSLMLRR